MMLLAPWFITNKICTPIDFMRYGLSVVWLSVQALNLPLISECLMSPRSGRSMEHVPLVSHCA